MSDLRFKVIMDRLRPGLYNVDTRLKNFYDSLLETFQTVSLTQQIRRFHRLAWSPRSLAFLICRCLPSAHLNYEPQSCIDALLEAASAPILLINGVDSDRLNGKVEIH